MFNPFAPFTPDLLNAFVEAGKTYFVRQATKRGRNPFDEEEKGAFVISHYEDLVQAQAHLGAISHDRYAKLYSWENEEDRAKLLSASSGPAGYKIYSSVFVDDWERGITDRVQKCIKHWISRLGWRPGRNDNITSDFYVQFGELYVRLKFRNQPASFKFEELEKAF